MSDGQHSIPFLSPGKHLEEHLQTEREKEGPAVPFRALVDSFELRISDCFDPPKVEAFVSVFRNIEKLGIGQGVHLVSPLSAAPSVAALLRRYVETKVLGERDNEMSSNGSIKSQPSSVHLLQGHNAAVPAGSVDSSPISQMRLATQAPMLAASQVVRRPLGELERNISRQPTLMPSSGGAQNSELKLGRPALGEGNVSREVLQNKTEHEEEAADLITCSQHQSRSAALTMAPRDQQVPTDFDRPHNHACSQHSKSALDVAREHQTNVNMQMRFRRWRAEAAAGRYIPRRACKIPRQQLKILNSDERWQPPLPGRDKRPGTVPIDLLNELTTKVDDAVKQPQPVSVQDPAIRVKTEALVRPAPGAIDDLQSSQELGESQWPPSPERKGPTDLLPPDSSLASADCRHQESICSEASVDEAQDEEGDAKDNSAVSSCMSQPSENRVPDIIRYPQSEVGRTWRSPSTLKPQPHEEVDPVPQNRRSVISSGESDRQTLRKIQVSETPYPGKATRPGCVAQVSEVMRDLRQCSDPSFVPSTYGEGTAASPHEIRKRANLQQQAPEAGEVRQQTLKREAYVTEPEVSVKRAKVKVADRQAQQFDPAFAPVFHDIRKYRRQALRPLTKDFSGQNPARRSISDSSDQTTEQSVASELGIVPKALNGTTRLPQVSTPLTLSSSRPASKNGQRGPYRPASTLSSFTGSVVSPQLFEIFQATYADYQGGKADFNTAITLLRKLRLSHKDPHPSLYDDFVWHRHHSYMPYVRFCDADEGPISYGVYYNQHIESPSHFAKVITASSLGGMSLVRSDSEQLRPDVAPSFTIARHPDKYANSVDPHVSISNISAAPAQVENPLNHQMPILQDDPEQLVDPMKPSQKSSVETWLEGTARAASLELGTPEDRQPPQAPEMPLKEIKPMQKASPAAPVSHLFARPSGGKFKKRPSVSPFAQTLTKVGKQATQHKDKELTPFKRWATAILSLPNEA